MTTVPTAPPQAASAVAPQHATKAINAAAAAQAAAKTPKHAANLAAPTPANRVVVLNINATAPTSNAVPEMGVRQRTQPVADQSITARQEQRVVLVPRKMMMGPMIISVLRARLV
jgi:hypothetical protein